MVYPRDSPLLARFIRICTDLYPRSSGLRKKVVVFQKPHYSEAFITSILLSIPEGVEGMLCRVLLYGRRREP